MSDVLRADDVRLLERLAEQHEASAIMEREYADSEPDPAYPLLRERFRQHREEAGREAARESQMAAFYRRLLSYVVPDREALGRALYIITQESCSEEHAASLWDAEPCMIDATREHWLGEADRLVRILGGYPAVPEAGTPLARIEALQAEVERRGLVGEFDSTPPEVALLRALDGSEASLDYVATAFHLTYHGIKEAPTWRECERQPCRVASGRLKSVRRVGPTPASDATPPPEPATGAPAP